MMEVPRKDRACIPEGLKKLNKVSLKSRRKEKNP